LAIPFLRDERPFVRDGAIVIVQKLPNLMARSLIEQCLYDPEEMIRDRAMKYFSDTDSAGMEWPDVLARFIQVAGDVKEFAPQIEKAKKLLGRKS
jgi:hypothetical protein